MVSVNQRSRSSRVRQIILTLAVAAFMAYAFSPAIQNRFGSVKPRGERVQPPGDVVVKTLDGHDWSLAANRGNVILVNFWATWCPPCRVETPALVQLHKEFATKGFMVVGINTDDDPPATVPEFIRRYAIPYPVLIPAASFPLLDSVETLPTSVLIDRSGRVARVFNGIVTESGLRDDIEALLAEKEGQV